MSQLVTVALAVYDPRIDWLETQLRSIEAQSCECLEVVAIDDASPTVDHRHIADAFSRCLRRVPYRLFRNPENIGSDLTFEKLTAMAEGAYVSYCDQDDEWRSDKTGALVQALENTGAPLAYCNLSVIDAEGRTVAGSLLDVRRRLRHLEGPGLASTLLFRNFTNGTAMVVRAEAAKSALPFARDMVADHWLTLWCAAQGSIAYLPEPLVRYRLHGKNQSAVMSGVFDKESYLKRRILPGLSRFDQYGDRLAHVPELAGRIAEGKLWFEARRQWFTEAKGASGVWKLRGLGSAVSMFELAAARMPEFMFRQWVRLIQRGVL